MVLSWNMNTGYSRKERASKDENSAIPFSWVFTPDWGLPAYVRRSNFFFIFTWYLVPFFKAHFERRDNSTNESTQFFIRDHVISRPVITSWKLAENEQCKNSVEFSLHQVRWSTCCLKFCWWLLLHRIYLKLMIK